MKLAEKVEKLLKELSQEEGQKSKALKNAERLADQFGDIKPRPYVVPMEKFYGLPVEPVK